MEKKRILDFRYKHKNNSSFGIKLNKEYNYLEGACHTPYGIVSCYSQGGENCSNYMSRFWYILNGYEYTRSINRRFTRLGLARLASKFAKEIYTKNKGKKRWIIIK